MAKSAVEMYFNGSIPSVPLASYDATKINLGTLMGSFDLGSNYEDKFVGPYYTQIMRPTDQTTAFPPQALNVIKRSLTEWWVFYIDNSAAAATRRVGLFRYDPTTHLAVWQGFITLTYPVATNHTSRGLAVSYEKYTTGTVSVSGTAVTGTGTTWLTDRQTVGSRIGFGSTDPTQISVWHQLSAIPSDTSITLSASGPSVTDVPYVIEDLRIVSATTNATATNGGLFVAKGLRYDIFTPTGTTIPAATTIDNLRAVYWLKDAATVTNTVVGGTALENKTDYTNQYVYCTDGAGTSLKIFKYNIRAALTPTTGATVLTGANVVITGTATTIGNITQSNNGIVKTLGHGPGDGISSLYINTTTRVYRIPVSTITSGSTSYLTSSDFMIELPPGGTSTHTTTNLLGSIDYCPSIDRLIIAGAHRLYVTRYKTDASPVDAALGVTSYQMDIAASSGTVWPHSLNAGSMAAACVDGVLFWAHQAASTIGGSIYVHPLAADWSFSNTNNAIVIAPKITLTGVSKLYKVRLDTVNLLGSSSYGKVPEPAKILYRTTGIDDNTGNWTAVPVSGDLSGVGIVNDIQFAFQFRTIGDINIPSRVTGLCLTYESQDDLPSQYAWNDSDQDLINRRFAFIQLEQFGSSLGDHTINVYRVDTGALVLTQVSTGTTNGVFEYYNGSSWVAGLGSDVIGTRRRFSATGSIPDGISVYVTISVA